MRSILILLLSASTLLEAQNFSFNFNTNGRRVCLVDAEVNTETPSVTIHFLDAATNTNAFTDVYKRPLYGNGDAWIPVAAGLPPGTTEWSDAEVNAGETWEYQIRRTASWTYAGQTYDAIGYTVGAVLRDNSGYQGQMILLAADNVATGLPAKYTRLKKELTGEGWFVNEIVVPAADGWDSGDAVVGIREQIREMYANAPAGDKPKMLFILGHVPMPRSGSTSVTAPDAHDQNKGARGCDGYYADIDGVYTDMATFDPGGLETPLAVNLPGDFKWDQDFFPSELEMAFGRVDFADLTPGALSEIELTGRYLDRLSNYKTLADGFHMGPKTGFFFGYNNSNDGSYRTLPNLSGAANLVQNNAGAPHPQWIKDNGPFQVYMQNAAFPEIGQWEESGMDATVFSSDQSYWGFNDEPQSFYYSRIRALLSLDTRCLVALWTTSAVNTFHQACTGDPLGKAILETMNYNAGNNNVERPPQDWDTQNWWNRTHFSYNGDPTLRLYQTAPPSGLTISQVDNKAVLTWAATPGADVIGYHIYKSATEFGIFERLTSSPISDLEYTDEQYQQHDWYMVRAVQLAESGCGTFLNPSMGVFVQGDFPVSATVENTAARGLGVFPNPADRLVTIVADFNVESLEILDARGIPVQRLNDLHQNKITLDISGLPAGVYLLKVINGTRSETREMVVI